MYFFVLKRFKTTLLWRNLIKYTKTICINEIKISENKFSQFLWRSSL